MDKASHSADNYNKQSPVPAILTSQTCRDLPMQPAWLNEDTLLIYSPPGLRASNKVVNSRLLWALRPSIIVNFITCPIEGDG